MSFVHDSNCWSISLFLSQPMSFSILFYPPIILRSEEVKQESGLVVIWQPAMVKQPQYLI